MLLLFDDMTGFVKVVMPIAKDDGFMLLLLLRELDDEAD